jgi:WD40 repeat protein
MKRRYVLFATCWVLATASASGESPKLKFVKEIGPGWHTDKWAWMGFVAFNQDGTMIASDAAAKGNDVSGDLTVWSFPEGKLIRQLGVMPEAISPNLEFVADRHGVVNAETGKPVTSLGEKAFAQHAFSPDSRYVAESVPCPKTSESRIQIVRLIDGKRIKTFEKHGPFSLAISPDGSTLAAGHWDTVSLWNMFTGQKLGTLRGFGRYVDSVSFRADGKLLAAGTDTGLLQIWDVTDQRRLQSIQFEWRDFISDPAFSPDGSLVAVGVYGSGTVWLVDVGSGKILDRKKISDLGCGSVAFSPDGRYLITPSTGGLIKWPYDRGGSIRVFEVSDR